MANLLDLTREVLDSKVITDEVGFNTDSQTISEDILSECTIHVNKNEILVSEKSSVTDNLSFTVFDGSVSDDSSMEDNVFSKSKDVVHTDQVSTSDVLSVSQGFVYWEENNWGELSFSAEHN